MQNFKYHLLQMDNFWSVVHCGAVTMVTTHTLPRNQRHSVADELLVF